MGICGQPFVGPVSAPKRAFALSEARRPSTGSGHTGRPRRTTRASWRTPEGHCESGRERKSRRLITPRPACSRNRLSHVLFSALDRRNIWPARLG